MVDQSDFNPRRIPELHRLEKTIEMFGPSASVKIVDRVSYKNFQMPLYSVALGTADKSAPCLGIFGGVHGLERIGSEVVIAWMHTLAECMKWDSALQETLSQVRLVFMPIVNPVGMYRTWRSNGNGVDLMRNSPVVGEDEPLFLVGGQTISNQLPWFRGFVEKFEDMEKESQALCRVVRDELLPSRFSIALDVHSGFGSIDRLWFPYAKTTRPCPHLVEVTALKDVFDRSYPNHVYKVEPQSDSYTTHGDLWDYMYDQHLADPQSIKGSQEKTFLPWTLEMGSWLWLKKNPRQLFSSLGPFNPLLPHRQKRILRRHVILLDFLLRAVQSHGKWIPRDLEDRSVVFNLARRWWYPNLGSDFLENSK